MNVVVVLRGGECDEKAVHWAATHCGANDNLQVILPYRELAMADCGWSPAERAADARREVARLSAARIAATARRTSVPGTKVEQSVVHAARGDVLADLASFCDVIVLGVPEDMPAHHAVAEARWTVACGVRAATGCRVVLVPQGGPKPTGLVVLSAAAAAFTRGALRYAIAAAADNDTSVRVLRPYHADLLTDIGLVTGQLSQSEALDIEIEEESSPAAVPPGVVGEVTRAPMTDALRELAGHVSLLVADCSGDAAANAASCDLAAVAIGELHVPAMLVPEQRDEASPDDRVVAFA